MLKRRSKSPRFRRPRSRGGWFGWWLVWRVPALALIVMAGWWFLVRPVVDEQGWVTVTRDFAICGERSGAAGCVADGDTVIIGFGSDQRRIRLTGFDAPELDGACPAEREAALAARAALHEWLGRGPFQWTGADDPPYDRYGRELREVRRAAPGGGREYLAETMIARGLAAESGWGARPVDWCAPR
ncbi:thermonuclease family protein [Erythrobacter sp. JK5]|uniref:thermonuclease family protein n=1 Tax=Erythrobacter sp. JK5 TaxID=2829500 RepID=UPI001BA99471|nr:hypothetical protein [Erythrobacter sp. JK5]QUL37015.1 hypothetical protein KDC96_11500 [Erythrobacter sp. JK5]